MALETQEEGSLGKELPEEQGKQAEQKEVTEMDLNMMLERKKLCTSLSWQEFRKIDALELYIEALDAFDDEDEDDLNQKGIEQ